MASSSQETVYAVDDDRTALRQLKGLLRPTPFRFVGFFCAEALLEEPISGAGCVVTEWTLSGMGGLGLLAALGARGCRIPLVYITAQPTLRRAVTAIKAGAYDFLEKPADPETHVSTIRNAVSLSLARHGRQESAHTESWPGPLSPREREVFLFLVSGESSGAIAAHLKVSERTVETHCFRIYQKLGVHSRRDLLAHVEGVEDSRGATQKRGQGKLFAPSAGSVPQDDSIRAHRRRAK